MAQYDVSFAKKLSEVALGLVDQGLDSAEARRTVVYLSRLSIELSLKALLEKAGKPVSEIRSRCHDLRALLSDVEHYEFKIDEVWFSGSDLRNITVPFLGHLAEMGVIIEAENIGASVYPNDIRYGDNVKDVPPEALAPASLMLANWVALKKDGARWKA